MAGGIFVSYRRDDNRYAAGRFYDRLAQHFGPKQIFMDVDTIEPGLDFVKVLNERVGSCAVLVAVIGPAWLDVRDANGRRRLDDPADFVRIEIEAALARDVRVVPLLVEGAAMPREADLPESLRSLARRNAVTLTHATFGRDVAALISVLEKDVRPKGTRWFGGSGAAVPPIPAKPPVGVSAAVELPMGTVAQQQSGARLGAWLFVFGALPFVIGAAFVFHNLKWSALGDGGDRPGLTGFLAGCAIVLGASTGIFFGESRVSKLEKLLCGIGALSAVAFVAWPFCDILKISFLGPEKHNLSGQLAAVCIAVVGTAALAIWWRWKPGP
jgi:hypothetical protein